jgi:hypothetical protein
MIKEDGLSKIKNVFHRKNFALTVPSVWNSQG